MKKTLIFLISLLISFSGFTKTPPATMPANYLKVPLIPQAFSYSCGAAVMTSILNYWKVYDGAEGALHKPLRTTPDYGTDPIYMIKLAKDYGLETIMKTNQSFKDLEKGLLRGESIILDFQAWGDGWWNGNVDYSNRWEDGHYAILVAMDKKNLYFMDPSSVASHTFIPRSEFMSRWHDYEIRSGLRVINKQMAIYIKGKTHMQTLPAAMIKTD